MVSKYSRHKGEYFKMNFTDQLSITGRTDSPKEKTGVKFLSLLLVFSLILMFSVPAFAATANTDSAKLYARVFHRAVSDIT